MKNILVLVPNLNLGGQQRAALQLAELLQKKHRVVFAVFDLNNRKYDGYVGMNLINIDVPATTLLLKRGVNLFRRIIRLHRIKKKYHIDVSIAFGHTADIANCLARCRDEIFSTIHNVYILERGKGIIDDTILRFSDKVIYVSKGQMEYYSNLFPVYSYKFLYCYNPCDADRIREISMEDVDFDIDEWTFTACGRLSPVKCYTNLINVFGILRQKYANIKLIIIGDGEQQEELQEQIRRQNLDNNVYLIGYRSNPFAYIAKSRGLCCSSYREAFSLSVVEGLACGVPVVSADCRFGPREILSENHVYGLEDHIEITDYGILTPGFENNNKDQKDRERLFAEAIDELLTNETIDTRLKENAFKRSGEFSLEVYANFWESLINEAE